MDMSQREKCKEDALKIPAPAITLSSVPINNALTQRNGTKETNATKTANTTKMANTRKISDEEKKAMHWKCEQACPSTADSSCVTECESAMYNCISNSQVVAPTYDDKKVAEDKEKEEKCKEDVLAKYKDFGK